jgi:hypothetical protein
MFLANVSSPSTVVPEWNLHSTFHIETIFEFASAYLHSNGCFFILLPEVNVIWDDVYGNLQFCNCKGLVGHQ